MRPWRRKWNVGKRNARIIDSSNGTEIYAKDGFFTTERCATLAKQLEAALDDIEEALNVTTEEEVRPCGCNWLPRHVVSIIRADQGYWCQCAE